MELKIKATRLYKETHAATTRRILHIGGARSSKSHTIAQRLIVKLITIPNRKILIARKTFPSLRHTCYKLVIDLLKQYGIYNAASHNKTEHTFRHNGGELLFTSIDDPQKMRSTEFNDIWCEEANELTYDDYITLKLRMSAQTAAGHPNQMFLSFNPSDERSWLRKLENDTETTVIHSSYLDNPFLNQEYIKEIESLKELDEEYWKIYGLGEYGKAAHIIYRNWDVVKEFPGAFDETIYGIDFGFNNPTAVIEINIKDNELFERELIYETRLTNSDLIARLHSLNIPTHAPIYADSEDPNRIHELQNAGFNVIAANKTAGSVKSGIEKVKTYKTHIHEESIHLIDEKKSYKWKEDTNGTVLDDPLKFNDHACDAERYALFTHAKRTTQYYFGAIQSQPSKFGLGDLGK